MSGDLWLRVVVSAVSFVAAALLWFLAWSPRARRRRRERFLAELWLAPSDPERVDNALARGLRWVALSLVGVGLVTLVVPDGSLGAACAVTLLVGMGTMVLTWRRRGSREDATAAPALGDFVSPVTRAATLAVPVLALMAWLLTLAWPRRQHPPYAVGWLIVVVSVCFAAVLEYRGHVAARGRPGARDPRAAYERDAILAGELDQLYMAAPLASLFVIWGLLDFGTVGHGEPLAPEPLLLAVRMSPFAVMLLVLLGSATTGGTSRRFRRRLWPQLPPGQAPAPESVA